MRAAVARLTAGASQRGAKGLRAMKEASDLEVRQPLTVLVARVVSWPEAGSEADFESRRFRIFATDRGSMPLQGLSFLACGRKRRQRLGQRVLA